jgi:heme A synthase
MTKYHIIVLQLSNDESPARVITPPEAIEHSRAMYYKTKYQSVMGIVVMQVTLSAFEAMFGLPARSILIGNLAAVLAVGALSCYAAWSTRKGLIQ